jgi:hypothetical protein
VWLTQAEYLVLTGEQEEAFKLVGEVVEWVGSLRGVEEYDGYVQAVQGKINMIVKPLVKGKQQEYSPMKRWIVVGLGVAAVATLAVMYCRRK